MNTHQVPTISLVMIRGTSSEMNVRGRLFEVTGPMKLPNDPDAVYCRAILADDSGVTIQVTFWNLTEVLYAQILSLLQKCVVLTAVQSQPSREGFTQLHNFCISYNGGVIRDDIKMKQKKPQTVSNMYEVAENSAFPNVLPGPQSASTLASPPARIPVSTTSLARGTPTPSPASPDPANTLTPKKRTMSRPANLIRFTCLKCNAGDMPSCGADGNPHAGNCVKCGFLEAPIVPFCPVTGEPHFDYTTM